MTIINDIKYMLRRFTLVELATAELVDAQRRLLEAYTGREFADSMCSYHEARIKRLKGYLKQFEEAP